MTDKHDFKAALDAIENDKQIDRTLDQVTDGHLETIQTALRLADRLQSGEVSEGMLRVWADREITEWPNHKAEITEDFKAMAAQMLKEIE